MDGKIFTFTLKQLIESEQADAGHPKGVTETQCFETQTACGDSVIVRVGGESESRPYLVAGFDDGVVCLLDLQKQENRSIKRPLVSKSDSSAAHLDQGSYDAFDEQAYEHPDSIISVEANSDAANVRIVTASKDGSVYVWKILSGPDHQEDDKLSYVADTFVNEPASKAKWLTNKCLLIATTYGSIF